MHSATTRTPSSHSLAIALATVRYGALVIGRRRLAVAAVTVAVAGCTGQAAHASGYVYWANERSNTIGRANLNGTGVNQRFITGADVPVGVAVTSKYVYWANNATGTIGRANLNGTSVNQRFITGADSPPALAIDATYVYWANFKTGTIGRANLNGTGVNQRLITGAKVPDGVAAG